MFHILVRSANSNPDAISDTATQHHYIAIADRPSRAVELVEVACGWTGNQKFTVDMASPTNVPPDIELEEEAVWRI